MVHQEWMMVKLKAKLAATCALLVVVLAALLAPRHSAPVTPPGASPDDPNSFGGCTIEQIRAGCRPALPPPHVPHAYGAGSYLPTFNPYLSVTDWYVDHSNLSGCASDSNNGISATCASGGVGPLSTYTEVASRWGSYTPILPQTTAIHFISDDNDNGATLIDPVIFYGTLSPLANSLGATIRFQGDGNGDLICSGTLGTVTAKARASNQVLSVATISNCGPPNLGLGYKIINSSRSNSIAWVANVSGPTAGPWNLTQPFNPMTFPPVTGLIIPVENDTWATGDSVSVYTPYAARLIYIDPKYARMDSNSVPATIYNLSNGGTVDFNLFRIPSIVNGSNWMEACSQRFLTINPSLGSASATGLYNSAFDDIWGGKFFSLVTNAGTNTMRIVGGQLGPANLAFSPPSLLDGDVVLMGATTWLSGAGQMGNVANMSTTSTTSYGTGMMVDGDFVMVAKNWGGPNIYGTGTLSIMCGGHIAYPGLTATGWLQLSSNVIIGRGTVACNGAASSAFAATLTPVCNLTVNATNLSAAATQTLSGTVSVVGGSSAVTFSANQSLTTGQPLVFASQPGVVYYSAITLVSGTAETLTTAYSGTTNAATTTTTTNTGFGDNAWTPGCGSIGTIGP